MSMDKAAIEGAFRLNAQVDIVEGAVENGKQTHALRLLGETIATATDRGGWFHVQGTPGTPFDGYSEGLGANLFTRAHVTERARAFFLGTYEIKAGDPSQT